MEPRKAANRTHIAENNLQVPILNLIYFQIHAYTQRLACYVPEIRLCPETYPHNFLVSG